MIANKIPTLGDLCDVELVRKDDIFAAMRLLQRWIVPEPTMDQLRNLTMLEVQNYLGEILGTVQQHVVLLITEVGKSKH